jgi:hypothetical protein
MSFDKRRANCVGVTQEVRRTRLSKRKKRRQKLAGLLVRSERGRPNLETANVFL